MVLYSEAFRARMVAKLTGPTPMTAGALAREVGVPQPTLSRWLKEASTLRRPMSRPKKPSPHQPPMKRPQDWTPEEKLAVVLEASGLTEADLGEFLRQKGLHEAVLAEWRTTALAALGGAAGKAERKAAAQATQRLRKLESELRRKDKALAEAAALLVLKKKAQALWGDEDEDMDPRSGA